MKDKDSLVNDKGGVPQTYSFDILKLGWVKAFARSRYVPLVFQTFMVMLFAYAIYACFVAVDDRASNFGIIMFWAVFWPSMIMISLVIVGRMWCGICPLGAISAAVQRFGLNKPFPRKLGGGIIALSLWIVIVWLVREILHISSHGHPTAWFFIGFVVVAVLVGWLFRNRSFCQHVCPIGIISGLWAMLSFVELRPKKEKCDVCRTYECVRGNGKVRGCPVGLHPGRLDSNRDCIYCLNCVKTCPYDSPQIRLRKPGAELVRGARRLAIDAGFLLWVPVVLCLKENMEHYFTPPFLVSVITWVQNILGTPNREGVWFAVVVVFNGVLLLGAYLVATRIATRVLAWDFKTTFATFSYMFAPVVLVTIGGHSLHYFFDTIWGQMVNLVAAPLGIYQYMEPPMLSPAGVSFVGEDFMRPMLYAVGFFWMIALPYAIARFRESNQRKALRAAIPFMIIALLIAGNFLWTHVQLSGGVWRW